MRQRTKFNYVVSKLNQQQATEVEDIITSTLEQDSYDRLKAELVRLLSTSRELRVRQLLSHEEVGDWKPSQFLRHLMGLAPDVPDNFLRTIWASRLPPHVQAILAGQTEGVWIQPPTSRIEFARSLHSLPQRASLVRRLTLQPAY
jgi:hypothetical protein